MKPDLLSILEAGYAVEAVENGWLEGLLAAAAPSIAEGLGAFAFSYNAADSRSFELRSLTFSGIPDSLKERLPAVIAQMPANYIEDARNAGTCSIASEIPSFAEITAIPEHLHEVGAYDVLGINVLDPTGVGCYLGAPLRRLGRVSKKRRATWGRIAAHVAAGFRIQRRLTGELPGDPTKHAEAILDGDGKCHHATGQAELASAQEALRTATRAMENARAKLRHDDPDRAIDEWKGLIAARWSLVEHFESDGKRFLLARRNDPHVAGPASLSRREQQIVGYAALGHRTKLIAYELGISDSTVRVLLSRVTAKLGVRSRAEAIAKFTSLVSGGADGDEEPSSAP